MIILGFFEPPVRILSRNNQMRRKPASVRRRRTAIERGSVPCRETCPERGRKRDRGKKGKLKDFPQEKICHDIPEEELDDSFGKGNWKGMPDEVFWQLRFEPAKSVAEKHVVKVYVGTGGKHQDEFLRGDHPATLFRGSIATMVLLCF